MRLRRRAASGGEDRRHLSSLFGTTVFSASLRLWHARSQVRSHGCRQSQGIRPLSTGQGQGTCHSAAGCMIHDRGLQSQKRHLIYTPVPAVGSLEED